MRGRALPPPPPPDTNDDDQVEIIRTTRSSATAEIERVRGQISIPYERSFSLVF